MNLGVEDIEKEITDIIKDLGELAKSAIWIS